MILSDTENTQYTCAVDDHIHAGVRPHHALHQARHVALVGDVGRHAQRRARAAPRARRRSQGAGGRCERGQDLDT